jgi:NADP-dependent 3-hydroxy acid dehydrogenase YdfG
MPKAQTQQPGRETQMDPRPDSDLSNYKAAGKLQGKVALITGGDSGIGRAVAVAYAMEGADVAIIYLNEHQDAQEAKRRVEVQGRRCITIAGDVGEEMVCKQAVEQTVRELGKLDIQQRRGTAPPGEHREDQRRATRAHLPH